MQKTQRPTTAAQPTLSFSNLTRLRWPLVTFIYFVLMVWGNFISTTNSSLLPAEISTLLLLLAVFLFSGIILKGILQTYPHNPIVSQNSPKLRRLAVSALGGLLLQFTLGGLVHHHSIGLACPRFPLCLDSFFPIPFSWEAGLVFFHRWWGILMLGVFVQMAVVAAKSVPELAGPTRRLFGLAVAQVFLGIGTVMSGLRGESRVVHAAVGYLIWGILFYVTIRAGALQRLWAKNGQSKKVSRKN